MEWRPQNIWKLQATSSLKKQKKNPKNPPKTKADFIFFFKWVKESTDVINVSMYSKYNLEPVEL